MMREHIPLLFLSTFYRGTIEIVLTSNPHHALFSLLPSRKVFAASSHGQPNSATVWLPMTSDSWTLHNAHLSKLHPHPTYMCKAHYNCICRAVQFHTFCCCYCRLIYFPNILYRFYLFYVYTMYIDTFLLYSYVYIFVILFLALHLFIIYIVHFDGKKSHQNWILMCTHWCTFQMTIKWLFYSICSRVYSHTTRSTPNLTLYLKINQNINQSVSLWVWFSLWTLCVSKLEATLLSKEWVWFCWCRIVTIL